MKKIHGQPLVAGYAEGAAYILEIKSATQIPKYKIESSKVTDEMERMQKAVRQSIEELETIRAQVLSEVGEVESGIFESHIMLLKDEKFIKKIERRITDHLINAEHAVDAETTRLGEIMQEIKDDYLRERSHDLRDIGERIIRNLKLAVNQRSVELHNLSRKTVIVATELLPSDTVDLDKAVVAAFVTERTGSSSHAAILAGARGIPFVTGIDDVTSEIKPNDQLLVNGRLGTVTISPTKSCTADFYRDKSSYDRTVDDAHNSRYRECRTVDGEAINLFANIGRMDDIDLVRRYNLKGIGLFRTEYLFIQSLRIPTFNAHLSAYKKIAGDLQGLPAIIRTMDVGGDKNPPFIQPQVEANPNMGLRGLRYSLQQRQLFKTQIRALVRASASVRNLHIMFPMVLGTDDLAQAIEMVHLIADQEMVKRTPPLGAMIETPAAVFGIREILREVQFISIGTNDLTQFILAADRNALDTAGNCSCAHPSVIRAIQYVVEAANEANKPVSICGEAAGDPAMAGIFIGLGVRNLSMSPNHAARVQRLIGRHQLTSLQNYAEKVLNCGRLADVSRIIQEIDL